MKYKWVYFDLDETLFDFNESSKMALREVFFELGLSDHEETYNEYYTINTEVWNMLQEGTISAIELKSLRWNRFLEKYGLTYKAIDLNELYLDSLIEYTIVYPGSFDVLKILCNDFRLVAVTNGLERVQKARLNISKLENFFEHVVISESIGCAKPQKEYFDFAFNLCGNPKKQEVILVGDGLESDIKGACNYGIDCIWFNPLQKVNPNSYNPTYEVRDLHDAVEIILI